MAEKLQAIGFHLNDVRLCIREFTVFHLQCAVPLHGTCHLGQKILARRHVFQQDTLLQMLAFTHDACHRHGTEQPMFQLVAMEVAALAQRIAILVALLAALNLQMECILDGLPIALEAVAMEGNALAQLCAHPLRIDFLQCDAMRTSDGVNKPDIGLEKLCNLYHLFDIYWFSETKIRKKSGFSFLRTHFGATEE